MENSQNREIEKIEYFWQYDGDGRRHWLSRDMAILQCIRLMAMINDFQQQEKVVRT
ncbi:hypothetical protein [Leptospira kirschneri]|uniref:hypothetical protein n=1 Tax=Leptospira kirschneri TaxID=29507 RepID=UPI0021C93686|nr:hypothetical protein [Leptospira kirschneri]UML78928.1 hypothetical protein FH602_02220 [Leptospira kirschneri]